MSLSPVVGLVLAVIVSQVSVHAQTLTYELRSLRGEADYRPLERSSMLYGPTEFRVKAVAPHRVVAVSIVGEGRYRQTGAEDVLCRSSDEPDGCHIDFGQVVSRRALRIDAEVLGEEGGTPRVVSRSFLTLDTHPAGIVTSSEQSVLVEKTRAEAIPPDRVTRLVRVEAAEGRGDDKRTLYRDDLTRDDFRVKVHGIRDAKILSVRPPAPERRKLIPILFNVAPYLTTRLGGQPEFGWQGQYEDMVFALIQGLRTAADRGVDVEYIVVAYAATGKLFGPFRLDPGSDRETTLEALRVFLEAPPLRQWQEKYAGRWVDNFGGMIRTLNDLYLREYDGLVQAVWITDGGSNSAGPLKRFQEKLWPERLEELNPEWNDARLLELLGRLDEGKGAHDDEMAEFIEMLGDYSPPTATRIQTFLHELDRGGTETLHPHRVNSSPMFNALFVPSDRFRRADRAMEFADFIQRDLGGQVFRLRNLDKSPTGHPEGQVAGLATVAQVLERTYEQLTHSYVIDLEAANPRQDGARHTLQLSAVDQKADGKTGRLERFDLAYMPYYTSSGSVRSRLLDYLRSGFKDLRLLSVYELRNHWSEEDVLPAWSERWQEEEDDQVRSVLFESWVSINLKRLQAGGSSKRERRRAEEAYGKLLYAGDLADRLENPNLARQAAAVADWYRADHPELFGNP